MGRQRGGRGRRKHTHALVPMLQHLALILTDTDVQRIRESSFDVFAAFFLYIHPCSSKLSSESMQNTDCSRFRKGVTRVSRWLVCGVFTGSRLLSFPEHNRRTDCHEISFGKMMTG
jgi:hypothetical protein